MLRCSILAALYWLGVWKFVVRAGCGGGALRLFYGCSTVVLICFTCPAITVATVIVIRSHFLLGRRKIKRYLPGLRSTGEPEEGVTETPHRREVNFNWNGKHSLSTGVGPPKTAAVGAEERAGLRRMWRLCERAGLQGAPLSNARAVTVVVLRLFL